MANALYNTAQDIPEEMLLGNMCFISLADMKVPAQDMENIFRTSGVPEKYIRKISPADAFRRATSSVKNKVVNIVDSVTNSMINVKVEIDEVKSDEHLIKRILGIKRIDKGAENIKYDSVGEIVFVRSTGGCITTALVPPEDANITIYESMLNAIKDTYAEWSVYHNKNTVKNIITRIIQDTHPVNLMPTGLCKFIPKKSAQDLRNLRTALFQLNAYALDKKTSNLMEMIPVVDTQEHRDLIERNVTNELVNDLFELTQEMKDKLTSQASLSSRTVASYVERFKELKEKAEDYEALLGVYMDSLKQQLVQAMKLAKQSSDSEEVA